MNPADLVGCLLLSATLVAGVTSPPSDSEWSVTAVDSQVDVAETHSLSTTDSDVGGTSGVDAASGSVVVGYQEGL